MSRELSGTRKARIRCAIYTRKSSEEGLEQDFNALDAQREACAAYVASQASEGWSLIPEHYDDGGLSGGTLERPALQKLLDDVRLGTIDIIVVYKVDRLTRSLLDFAKLVEAFDAADVSFVSVTQSFNTTTSMGRLTLNMLLSFAQFEREVTAERIRDKIAASKAKGMWMGGTPPIGYEPDGRSLKIVDDHAAIVRDIYRRYLTLGNVRHVAQTLELEEIHSPWRSTRGGHEYGGRPFSRGQIYQILKNPIYAGDIAHKGTAYPGNHEAIIEREQWNAVQAKLASHVRGHRTAREASTSLLAGKLFDPDGDPLIPVHTSKFVNGRSGQGRRRYRYYVSQAHHLGQGDATRRHTAPSLRIPAIEIEQVVAKEIDQLLSDPVALLGELDVPISPVLMGQVRNRTIEVHERLTRAEKRKLLDRAVVHPDRLELTIATDAVAVLLGLDTNSVAETAIARTIPVSLTRSGHSLRIVEDNGLPAIAKPDPVLLGLLGKARGWWKALATGAIDIASLARAENVTASYVTRVIRLSFLAPDIVEAILTGSIRADIDGSTLLSSGAIPVFWREQRTRFLAM